MASGSHENGLRVTQVEGIETWCLTRGTFSKLLYLAQLIGIIMKQFVNSE